MAALLALPFGFAIGILLGLVGGGGSILAVPVLIYVLGEPVKDATTASLLIVAASATVAAAGHHRRGCVAVRTAVVFAGTSSVGAVLGTVLNRGSRSSVILLVLAVVMFGAAVVMLRGPRSPVPASRAAGKGKGFWLRLLPAGMAVGILTGYVGVGGGFLIVPVLTILLALDLDRAIGTSLAIIALTSSVGLVAHLQSGHLNWSIALPFAAASVGGAILGARYSARTSSERLTQLFAALVIAVALVLGVTAAT